jgi:hypothetical protein
MDAAGHLALLHGEVYQLNIKLPQLLVEVNTDQKNLKLVHTAVTLQLFISKARHRIALPQVTVEGNDLKIQKALRVWSTFSCGQPTRGDYSAWGWV